MGSGLSAEGETVYAVSACVVQGKDLQVRGRGSSDAYVKIICGPTQHVTRIVKSELNPAWNDREDFIFKERPTQLMFEVYHHNTLFSDAPMGVICVELADLWNAPPELRWYKLNGVDQGEIQLQICCREPNAAEEHRLTYLRTLGVLRVEMVRARCINKGHWSLDGLRSELDPLPVTIDPFLEVKYGMHTFRSQTLSNTSNPHWDEVARMWVTEETKDYRLQVCVMDDMHCKTVSALAAAGVEQKAGDGDDDGLQDSEARQLGRVNLDLRNVVDHRSGGVIDAWLPLERTSEQMTDKDQNIMRKESKAHIGEDFGVTTSEEDGEDMAVRLRITFTRKADAEREFFKHLFSRFDTNKNGTLSKAEVGAVLDSMGVVVGNDDINRLFSMIDQDDNGNLNVSELHKLLLSAQFQNDPMSYALLAFCLDGADGMHRMVSGIFNTLTHRSELTDASEVAAESELPMKASLLRVMDRKTGLILDEHIPTYIKIALNSMYRTSLGSSLVSTDSVRLMLRTLSATEGAKMDAPESKSKIAPFVEMHAINTDELLVPLSDYATFNEFFYRRLKPGARPVADPDNAQVAVSPADCRMVVFPSLLDASQIWIKGNEFTVQRLCGPRQDLAELFEGGSLAIARLAPQDYHRWHFPVTGVVGAVTPIEGTLYTVNPIAVRKPIDVFTENTRYLCELETEEFGKVLLIAVGATLVGSVNVLPSAQLGKPMKKGEEHGFFAFGGSTTLVLFQKGRIVFDRDLVANSKLPVENLVSVGMRIGIATDAADADAAALQQQALG